ncbi:MAG: hydantoinase/carbamoylase family amidase [Pseudomonadota bacterium]
MSRASSAIDQQRLWDRHMAIAKFGATGRGGVNRQALTEEDGQARAALAGWATARGFDLYVDDAANLFVRRNGTDADAPAVLSGSHLDTQPAGGNFDGIFGVLSAFEVLEALDDAGISHKHPIEAVVWTNEEGCRYAPGCTGSMVFSGKHSIDEFLDNTAPDGSVLRDDLARTIAMTPDAAHRAPGIPVAGYIETHIEQGPRLEAEGLTVGAVTGIQGGSSFEVVVTGEDGHAGTVPLKQRRDAFRSAVAMIDALYKETADPQDTVRFTVGRFQAYPGSPNTIPGEVRFTIDFRHPDAAYFAATVARIPEICQANAGPCDVTVSKRHVGEPADFDETVIASIERIAGELDIPAMRMSSGADHDAKLMVPLCPTGMIFVPCLRGISHNEAERADAADLAAGARVLADALVEMANG